MPNEIMIKMITVVILKPFATHPHLSSDTLFNYHGPRTHFCKVSHLHPMASSLITNVNHYFVEIDFSAFMTHSLFQKNLAILNHWSIVKSAITCG